MSLKQVSKLALIEETRKATIELDLIWVLLANDRHVMN
jgi:hypothetical protein